AKLSGAKTFLQDLLIGGPVPSAVLDAKASGAGIAGRTLKRARKELGVVSTRDGFGEGSEWMAALPFHSDQGEEGTMAPVAPGDALSLEDPVAERAAIMEFEGGLTRSEAEQLAGDEVGT